TARMYQVHSVLSNDDSRSFSRRRHLARRALRPLSATGDAPVVLNLSNGDYVVPLELAACISDTSRVRVAACSESDARTARFLLPGSDVRPCRPSLLPWERASVDLVICLGVLECLVPAEVSGTLAEIRRVLKLGGIAVVAVASPYATDDPCFRYQFFTEESLA